MSVNVIWPWSRSFGLHTGYRFLLIGITLIMSVYIIHFVNLSLGEMLCIPQVLKALAQKLNTMDKHKIFI